jgi:hypothetical protein
VSIFFLFFGALFCKQSVTDSAYIASARLQAVLNVLELTYTDVVDDYFPWADLAR